MKSDLRLGIMQPYFFPYLGYFDLINYSDRWIVFDTVQYIRHGWMNRNRILHSKEGWQYINTPLKKQSRNTIIKDIEIQEDSQWKNRILSQMEHYKKKAPNYRETIRLVEECLDTTETYLSRLNVNILEKVCSYVGIPFAYKYFSEMKLDLGAIKGPGDWALRISEALSAQEYVNPAGGLEIFNSSQFDELGIKLTIRNLQPIEYTCRGYSYVPQLSIIDVLMWNEPVKVKAFLEKHKH